MILLVRTGRRKTCIWALSGAWWRRGRSTSARGRRTRACVRGATRADQIKLIYWTERACVCSPNRRILLTRGEHGLNRN